VTRLAVRIPAACLTDSARPTAATQIARRLVKLPVPRDYKLLKVGDSRAGTIAI
jgi:hypothetical protein